MCVIIGSEEEDGELIKTGVIEGEGSSPTYTVVTNTLIVRK